MKIMIGPRTKIGIDTPRFAPAMVPTSMLELRLRAEMMPNRTPSGMAIRSAKKASSMVVGRREMSMSVTGSDALIEVPRSPRSRPATKSTYCTKIGRSKPWAWS